MSCFVTVCVCVYVVWASYHQQQTTWLTIMSPLFPTSTWPIIGLLDIKTTPINHLVHGTRSDDIWFNFFVIKFNLINFIKRKQTYCHSACLSPGPQAHAWPRRWTLSSKTIFPMISSTPSTGLSTRLSTKVPPTTCLSADSDARLVKVVSYN